MLALNQPCVRQLLLLPFPPNLKFFQKTQNYHPFSTLSSLLNLCDKPQLLKQFHARLILHGHHQNLSLTSNLIESYANLGLNSLCFHVFNSISNPSWEIYNRVLRILAKSGEFKETLLLYDKMVSNSMYPDEFSYPFVLRSCKHVLDGDYGRRVHGHLVKLGFDVNEGLRVGLAEFYGELGEFENARQMFDEMPVRRLDYWNSLIVESLQNGNVREIFGVFRQMIKENIWPNSVCLVNLLRASTELNSLKIGVLVHGLIVVSGLSEDVSVCTALITMYSRIGNLKNAYLVFKMMPDKDRVVWNLMISAYFRSGQPRKSLELLVKMSNEGIRMDLYTALAAILSTGELKLLEWGKQIHAHGIRNGLNHQVSVQNSLIDMYSKCDSVEAARKVFNLVIEKTEVSWSSMIKGFVIHERYFDALSLFARMKCDGFLVDSAAIVSILPACVNAGALEQLKYIHGCTIKYGLLSIPSVNTELLASYAKCGCIDMARRLFNEEEIDNKDTITWNSLISAYSKHGEWQQCFDLYEQMKRSYFRPDSITFLGLLTACVNSGHVNEGWKIFKEMTETFGFQPSQEHYACMVDLLGKAGHIDKAKELINSMPIKADARVWGPLLSACKMHSETEVAELAAEKLIEIEPTNAGNYVLMSNIYAASGKWDKVAKMRSFLKNKGLKKTPGCSWLEVNGKVHEFRVADRSHPRSNEIYKALQYIELEIEDNIKASLPKP
ncbi:putative pentatricopeptide repeat-containing protein At3g01580 [Chenopodium quinoa]|uniref:putative pentatricopeptide repeat-containing protein At3g01580 n=1 Tax=Chenopodium quinoa TaxID=63459 RepID=UPI000B78FCA0|nr:putative pentatricopeptide repeat-containing protein At3g01580 [Chenopodium quinoa]